MEVILGKKAGFCPGVRNAEKNDLKEKEENWITAEIAKLVELMIIIGEKESFNTNKLYDIAVRECRNAMIVETMEDLYINYIRRFKKVGVMAGASTPQEMIDKVVEILKNTETEGYMYENSR